MKRLLAMIMVLTLTAALAACGGGGAATPNAPAASSTPAAPSATAAPSVKPAEPSQTPEVEDEEEQDSDGEEGGAGGDYEDDPTYQGAMYLYENATAAYIGATDAGEDVVFIETEDIAAMAIANSDMESMSFVGPFEMEDTFYSISDEASGLTLSFEIVEADEDGNILLDLGELEQIGLIATDVETAVQALLLIAGFTDAVL